MVTPSLPDRRAFKPLMALLAVFFLSRAIYFLMGVRFQSEYLVSFWQFIDPELLQHRLGESLFFLHSQPPLFNLMAGLFLKTFPANYAAAWHASYLLIGAVMTISLYQSMRCLDVGGRMAFGLTTAFIVSPQTVLLENHILYDYPLAGLLTLLLLALCYYVRDPGFGKALTFFFLAAVVVLTRSMFHAFWIVAIYFIVRLRRGDKGKTFAAMALPLCFVLAVCVKNAVYFGSFSTSTWLGPSLLKTTAFNLPDEERLALVDAGKLSRISLIRPYSPLKDYGAQGPVPERFSRIPVLTDALKSTGFTNFNSWHYLSICKAYQQDAVATLTISPFCWTRAVARGSHYLFHSISDYWFLNSNIACISAAVTVFDIGYHGNFKYFLAGSTSKFKNISYFTLFGFLSGCFYAARWIVRQRESETARPQSVVLLFILVTITYVFLVSGLEYLEAYRYRFMVEPYAVVLTGFCLSKISRRGKD